MVCRGSVLSTDMATLTASQKFKEHLQHLKSEQAKLEQAISAFETYEGWIRNVSNVRPFQKLDKRSAKPTAIKILLLSALGKLEHPVSRTKLKHIALVHKTGSRGITLKEISDYLQSLENAGLVTQTKNLWTLTKSGRECIIPEVNQLD